MITKKQRNILFGISVVVLALFFFNQLGFLSFISGEFMDCNDAGTNKVSCKLVKEPVRVVGSGGRIGIFRRNWVSGDEGRRILLEKARFVHSDLNQFLNTHTTATFDSTPSGTYGIYEPHDTQNDWANRIIGISEHQVGSQIAWAIPFELPPNILQNSAFVIKGTSSLGDFETFGLCEGTTFCFAFDPFPNDNIELTNLDITIYFKNGGYSLSTLEEDACNEFSICQTITIFRFENNQCTQLEIDKDDRQGNDYTTLNDCNEQIVTQPTTINIYRFEENACTLMTINEENRQSNDFNSLSECEQNIEVPETPSIPTPINITIIVVILLIVGVLIFLFLRLRKK